MVPDHQLAIREIYDEFDQVIKLVTTDPNRRSLGNVQMKILLKTRITGLITSLNAFEVLDIPVEEKASVYQNILDKLSQILCHKPLKDPEIYWYRLEVLRYNMIVSLITSWGEAGKLRMVGAANALANILTGIEKPAVESILVDTSHPEFRARNAVAINSLFFYSAIYALAATHIYAVPRERIEEWVQKAIDVLPTFLSIIEKNWNIPIQVEIDKRLGTTRALDNCSAMILFFNEIINTLLLFQTRLQNNWPELPSSINFIDITSNERFLSSLKKLYSKLQALTDDLRSHHEKGTFGPNINPYEHQGISQNLTIATLTHFILQGLQVIQQIEMNKDSKKITELETIISEMETTFERIFSRIPLPQFLTSSAGEKLGTMFQYFIFFVSYYAIHEQDIRKLRDIQSLAKSSYFSKEGIERYPQLYGLYLTALLSFAAEGNNQELLLETSGKLINLSDSFVFQPRDSFAVFLLGNITKLSLSKIKAETFETRMKKKLEKITEYTPPELINKISDYLTLLSRTIRGEEVSFNETRLSSPTPFDPYSILIPNLTKFNQKNDFGELVYLPFYLATDYVL
jgi:ribosomal protein S17E